MLWSTSLVELTGSDRVATAVLPDRSIAVDVVALNNGFQPEVGLARALGLSHRFVASGLGHLATEADEDGRTSLGSVFAVGDGAALGGARVAAARGRLAGLAAARDLGHAAPEDSGTRRALRRALAFQDALWRVFPLPPVDRNSIADATIVCRCEEVTAGALRTELAAGLHSLAALKKATRAGMGRCQGRFCAATIVRLCPGAVEPDGFAAPRAPVRPVPAAPLMQEAPEFKAPLLEDMMPPLRDAGSPDERFSAQIAVIGGGIAGLCTAYYLAQGGADVMIVERDEVGMAASTANAGSPACAIAVLRFHRRHARGWRSGRAHLTAGAAQHRVVAGDRRCSGRNSGYSHRGRPDAGRGCGRDGLAASQICHGTTLGDRKSRVGCQRTVIHCAGLVGPHGRRRFRSGRGLWRSAARDPGSADSGVAAWRPDSGRRSGVWDRAGRLGLGYRHVARADRGGYGRQCHRDHGRPVLGGWWA